MKLVTIHCNTIEFCVSFVIDDVLTISLKRNQIDEDSGLPEYHMECHIENAMLPTGNYIISDVAMSIFITIISGLIRKHLIFKGIPENEIEIKFFNTSGDETPMPLFISDNTPDELTTSLIERQIDFGAMWQEFQQPQNNIIWDDTIQFLMTNGFLTDFLCLVNIERKFSINLGVQ